MTKRGIRYDVSNIAQKENLIRNNFRETERYEALCVHCNANCRTQRKGDHHEGESI